MVPLLIGATVSVALLLRLKLPLLSSALLRVPWQDLSRRIGDRAAEERIGSHGYRRRITQAAIERPRRRWRWSTPTPGPIDNHLGV